MGTLVREKINWTRLEWRRIYAALKKDLPDRNFAAAKSIHELKLSPEEIQKAVEHAILPGRQRVIKDTSKFKKGLYRYLQGQDVNDLKKDAVIWTEEEWQRLAVVLTALQPHKNLLYRPSMDCLVGADIEAAMVLLPEDRRRSMHLGFMREKLAAVYKEARETNNPMFKMKLEDPNPELAAIIANPETEVAPQAPAPENVARKPRGDYKLTHWNKDEWIAIAECILSRQPKKGAEFLKGDFSRLTAADVRDVQDVLPEARRRVGGGLSYVVGLKKRLVIAFAHIAAERRKAEQRENDEKARAARIETVAPPVEEAPPVEPAPARATSMEVMPTMPAVNAWEATFKPMMSQLTTQFAHALAPMVQAAMAQGLQQAIAQSMATMPAMIPQPPTPAPAATPDSASQAAISQFKADNPMPKPAPPRPKIGVIGPLPQQANELVSAYPHLQITCVDSGDTQERASVAQCERVIGMTKFMNHSADAWCAKNIPSYTRVTGGVTAIKHQIDTWIKAGVLPGERRTEARA